MRLITNYPEKVEALVNAGIDVVERISAVVPESDENARYLETKREKMGASGRIADCCLIK